VKEWCCRQFLSDLRNGFLGPLQFESTPTEFQNINNIDNEIDNDDDDDDEIII